MSPGRFCGRVIFFSILGARGRFLPTTHPGTAPTPGGWGPADPLFGVNIGVPGGGPSQSDPPPHSPALPSSPGLAPADVAGPDGEGGPHAPPLGGGAAVPRPPPPHSFAPTGVRKVHWHTGSQRWVARPPPVPAESHRGLVARWTTSTLGRQISGLGEPKKNETKTSEISRSRRPSPSGSSQTGLGIWDVIGLVHDGLRHNTIACQ